MKPRMPDSPIAAIWRRRGVGKRGKREEGGTNLLAKIDEFTDSFEWELISALIGCLFCIVTDRFQCCRGLWDEVIPPPIMFESRVACDTFWSAKNWMRNLSASKSCTSSKS